MQQALPPLQDVPCPSCFGSGYKEYLNDGPEKCRNCDGLGLIETEVWRELAETDWGCHANRDGECSWVECPQLRDTEPKKSDRSCPLWVEDDDE